MTKQCDTCRVINAPLGDAMDDCDTCPVYLNVSDAEVPHGVVVFDSEQDDES